MKSISLHGDIRELNPKVSKLCDFFEDFFDWNNAGFGFMANLRARQELFFDNLQLCTRVGTVVVSFDRALL